MALKVYESEDPGTAFSVDGAMTNPIVDVAQGRDGSEKERKVYLRADNASTYTLIRIKATSILGDEDINPGLSGATGWGIKLLLDQDRTPTAAEWDAQPYADDTDGAITVDDIGPSESTVYVPFWIKLVSPARIPVGAKTDISLVIMYKETA